MPDEKPDTEPQSPPERVPEQERPATEHPPDDRPPHRPPRQEEPRPEQRQPQEQARRQSQRQEQGRRPEGRQRGQSGQQRPQGGQRQQGQQQQAQAGGGSTDISVVIPLFNEEESLKELHQQLRAALSRTGMRYELLFVDDGSTDKSFQVLRDLKRTDHKVKIVRFRRNYGKSAALSVGFEKAQGNYVITLDADLQDDPTEIPSLIKRLNDGYDLISGWKKIRRDPISKTIPSRFFNFVTGLMTGIRIHDFNCGLKAYRRDVVKSVKVYGELHRYIPVLAHWEGFRIGEMAVGHRPRKYGKTKFGVGRFWKGFLDLLTALFTTRYLRRPLHLFGFWGGLFALAGAAIDGWLIVEWWMGRTALGNRPLFLGGIFLILVGVQFISLGLLGEMISKTSQSSDEYSIREFIR